MTKAVFSEDEIAAIVRGLESCTTAVTDFPHRSHLVVATWYLSNATVLEAQQKMRASILRFLDHYQIEGKYNETITLFWIILVARHLRTLDPSLSLVARTNSVVEALSDSRLLFEYYSKELLWSEQALHEWVEPDLKALD